MDYSNRVPLRVQAHVDLVDQIARFDTFRVCDRLYTADLLIPQLTIRAKDLILEACQCSAHILYWGLEASRAKKHVEMSEHAYRSWRERAWLGFKTSAAGETKAPSDAMCEKLYRTLPEYGDWQQRRVESQHGADCAHAVYEAFRAKSELIKTIERIMRDETGGAYYVVEDAPRTIPRSPTLGEVA